MAFFIIIAVYIHKSRLLFCNFGFPIAYLIMEKINNSFINNILYFIKQPNKSLLIIVFFLSFFSSYSQNHKFFVPDSLKKKSYKELYAPQFIYPDNTLLTKIYANAYLNKAKNNKDTVRIANGYSQLVSIAGRNSKFKITLNYCDSIIALTKNKPTDIYPTYGYMVKGEIYYTIGDYKKSLINYLVAQKYEGENKNIEQLYYIQNGIGQLKMFWGNYNEASNIFKKNIMLLNNNSTNIQNSKILFLINLMSLSNSYCLTKQIDSALFYVNKGLAKSITLKDSLFYHDFISQLGTVQYYQGKYKEAIKNLDISFPYMENLNGLLNSYYYKGLCYQKLSKNSLAFENFKKADSIYNLSKDITPEIRNIQLFFINYYKNRKDSKNQLKYIDKLLQVDSVITQNRKYISETIVKKYDRPALLKEKEKIIKNLHEKERKSFILIIGLSILIVIFIGFFVKYYQKQELYKKRFKKLILAKKTQIKPILVDKRTTKLQGISIQIIEQILKNLESFELNNEFINNNLTLNILAKTLETNSNYLSKIINFYKEKNYSNYISDLRIDYCIKKLKEDTIFRKYAIKAIASEVGFNNTESFSKAFFTKTGIYPSFFIKNLNKISI